MIFCSPQLHRVVIWVIVPFLFNSYPSGYTSLAKTATYCTRCCLGVRHCMKIQGDQQFQQINTQTSLLGINKHSTIKVPEIIFFLFWCLMNTKWRSGSAWFNALHWYHLIITWMRWCTVVVIKMASLCIWFHMKDWKTKFINLLNFIFLRI